MWYFHVLSDRVDLLRSRGSLRSYANSCHYRKWFLRFQNHAISNANIFYFFCGTCQWTTALCSKCFSIWKQVMEIYCWLQNWLYWENRQLHSSFILNFILHPKPKKKKLSLNFYLYLSLLHLLACTYLNNAWDLVLRALPLSVCLFKMNRFMYSPFVSRFG